MLRNIIAARARGLGVILISHNVQHVLPVGDRFVILSRGRPGGAFHRREVDELSLQRLMGGGPELQELSAELESLRKERVQPWANVVCPPFSARRCWRTLPRRL